MYLIFDRKSLIMLFSTEHVIRRQHFKRRSLLNVVDFVVREKERHHQVVALRQVFRARLRGSARQQDVASLDQAEDGRHDRRRPRLHHVFARDHEQQVRLQHGHPTQEGHQLHRIKFGKNFWSKLSLNYN